MEGRDTSTAQGRGTLAKPRTLSALSAVAGVIHLGVVPAHLREYVPFGIFFIVVGVLQLVGSRLLLRQPQARWYLATAIGNGALVVLWVVSRTVGLPIGPMPWTPEQVGLLDVASKLIEVALVYGSVMLLLALQRRQHQNDTDLGFGSSAQPTALTGTAMARKIQDIPELITIPEASHLTGISESTLLRLSERGDLAPVRIGRLSDSPGTILIHADELELLVEGTALLAE